MLRLVAGVFLALHGLVHLMGFVVAWKLGTIEGLPYTTTLLNGSWDVGPTGLQVLGLVWLVAALGFVAVGFGIIVRQAWWSSAIFVVAFLSLVITALQWPEAQFGLYIDLAVIAALLIGRRGAPRSRLAN